MVPKEKKREKLENLLTRQMRSQGWENPRQFYLGSGINQGILSIETVRRAFSPVAGKNMEPSTLMIICKFLGFTAQEICDILRTYTDDKIIWPLLNKEGIELTTQEEALLEVFRAIRTNKPELLPSLADMIDIIAMNAGVDSKTLTNRLRVHIVREEV